jgi:hypothetical protein
MDLTAPFIVERERHVHVHSAFIARPHNGSIGEIRIALLQRLKILTDYQLGREEQELCRPRGRMLPFAYVCQSSLVWS